MTKYMMYAVEELFPADDGNDMRCMIWTTEDRPHAERIRGAILSGVQTVVIEIREIEVDTDKWYEVPDGNPSEGSHYNT